MISVGDIEIELALRIAVCGRLRDLAELARTLQGSRAVILLPIKEQSKAEENGDERIWVSVWRTDS